MKKTIQLNGKNIEYTIRKSKKAKKLRLTMYCDSDIVVTLPKRLSERFVESFILDKANWIIEKMALFKERKIQLKIEGSYKENKRKTEEFAKERLAYYNKFYGLNYNRVLAKNHRHRWGSCSIKRNINFNYRILFLPLELADYIIVHELCHLQEMNHSKRFWALVEKMFPDYKERVRELRKVAF